MNGGGRRTPTIGNAPELPFGTTRTEGDQQGGKRMRASIVSRMVAVMGLLVFSVPAAQAGSAGGGTPGPLPSGTTPMSCRVVDGDDVQAGVTVSDAYGTKRVQIRGGRVLCTSIAVEDITPIQPFPFPLGILQVPEGAGNALRCYTVTSNPQKGQPATPEPNPALIEDGLHYSGTTFIQSTVQVGDPQFLCLPAIVECLPKGTPECPAQ
jgi:hypothetical protein